MMGNNYAKIVQDNLKKLFKNLPKDLARALPATQNGDAFLFEAFGETCEIRSDGIFLGELQQTGVIGILISLYALNTKLETCLIEPLKAFKDLPNSMPYAGAFVTHTQQILVSHVDAIEESRNRIIETLKGCEAPAGIGGDFSFMVYPLPKIALCYIFYEADEDFPASVPAFIQTMLFHFYPSTLLRMLESIPQKRSSILSTDYKLSISASRGLLPRFTPVSTCLVISIT